MPQKRSKRREPMRKSEGKQLGMIPMDTLTQRRRAQTLRKNMTLEERILWYQYLKDYPVQWNRQKVFGSYIADFYCKRAKLIVELDGSGHFTKEGLDHDAERTAYLNSLGLMVLRFCNTDVKTNLQGVCESIDLTVKSRL